MASLAIPPFLKRYWLPLLLFSLGLFFQLVVLPSSYPPTHYDVLGVGRYASIEEVAKAYDQIAQKWQSDTDRPSTSEFIKIRYAFELLSNPTWKRDYDLFSLDEQLPALLSIQEKYNHEDFSKINLPLLNPSLSDLTDQAFNVLTHEKLVSSINTEKPLLVQVYSTGSQRCAQFVSSWRRIDELLEGVTETGMVELGDFQFALYHVEMKFTRQPFFRNGVPALVAYPPNCRSADCYIRYQGEISVDSLVDWMATTVLGLPRIPYYTRESLGPKFIAKSGYNKIKIIFYSSTGERAAPYLRQLALQYSNSAAFAFILWREQDSQFWFNSLGVESAPAFVVLKGRITPFVHHGDSNRSEFVRIIEELKNKEIPQLRSDTSIELGCDGKGFSRAGESTLIWYCLIVAGRPSIELSRMREIVWRAQEELMGKTESNSNHNEKMDASENMESAIASKALKEKRLTFAWLDGELQKKICIFYLTAEQAEGTCGPRTFDDLDVPRLLLVRFQRETEDQLSARNNKAKNINNVLLNTLRGQDGNFASQLVARYNGSEDIHEINQWISQIIKDGDTREIPFFTQNVPELVLEEPTRKWSGGAHIINSASSRLKGRINNVISNIGDYSRDPRIGPSLLLCACISFGAIWLKNTSNRQTTQSTTTNQGEKASDKGDKRGDRKRRKANNKLNNDTPKSITDQVPKDAYNLLSSGSDSD